jgi:hypothetical protein
MGGVRLSGRGVAPMIVVFAACRAASAMPVNERALPPGWQALPLLARAATDAVAGAPVERVAAWGEPAMGCYAAELALRGPARDVQKVRDEILGSLRVEPRLAGLRVHDAAVGSDGTSELAFERDPYAGLLRATAASDGRLALFACFWNQREPTACAAACRRLAGGA